MVRRSSRSRNERVRESSSSQRTDSRDRLTSSGDPPRSSTSGTLRLIAFGALLVLAALVAYALIPPTPVPQQVDRPAETRLTTWQDDLQHELARLASPVSSLGQQLPAGYVGAASCQECHQDRYNEFAETMHAKSFTLGDRLGETDDRVFQHQSSSSQFEAMTDQEGRHWHQQTWLGDDGQPLASTRQAMHYAMGSGVHGITPIYEQDGFLMQSPLTWYAQSKQWEMSPGFDQPFHQSFSRPVTPDCLFCHVGQLNANPESVMKYEIAELSIGCERCHGPGEAHIAAVQLDDFVDTTPAQIVHPGKLDRSAAEAVCQQCHLQAAAAIAAPGQNAWSFRPGDELRPHRSDFQRTDSAGNKVVGHVEQLHLSRCYTQTSTLTCVTCHDPHHQPRPEDQIDIYRDACLQCHQDVECGVDRMKRIATNDNDCSACHMPKIDTEISHAALHNHTIAVFDAKGEIVSTPPELPTDSLKDVLTVPDLPAEERDRRRAIATVKLSMMDPAFKATETELKSAYQYLMETYRQGQNADRDGRLKLAQLALSARQSDLALQVAESILTDDVPDDIEQAVALEILARLESGRGNVAIAEEYYNQLIRRRQNANDYYSLALCRLSSDDIDGCIELAEKALSLKPDLIPAHEMLAELLSTVRPQQATRHATVARQLNVARQQAQKRPK